MKKRLLNKISPIWLFLISTPLLAYLIFFYTFSAREKLIVITAAALFYVSLALLHHEKEKTVKIELMIEYILIAALSLMVVYSLVG